jgi:hypothetical protein
MQSARGAKDLPKRSADEPAKAASLPQNTVGPPVATQFPADEGTVAHGLKTRLAAVVQGRNVIAAGSFHLVGLAEIRERLGPDWERVREKVHQQTRRIIERHIAPQDVYFAGGADDYVLVFAILGKGAAQLVCAKITQEVQQRLLGDSETRDIGIRTLVSETDGSLRIEKAQLSDLVVSAVAAATASAPAELVRAEPPMSPASDPHASALPQPTPCVIVYRPVWDVQREVLSTFLSRRRPILDAAPDELSRLDLEALRAGSEVLTDLYRKQFRLRLSFPVSFEAIASAPRFRAYVELCRTIPEPVRKLVAFELVDLPMGVLYGRLAGLTAALRPYCGLVLATVDWWRADLSQFTNTGIRLVNAVIPLGSSEKHCMTEMDRFARAAGKAGLQSAVEGVGTSSLALAAKAAGLDFISGDRIGPCLDVPYHMIRVSWSELYFDRRPAA